MKTQQDGRTVDEMAAFQDGWNAAMEWLDETLDRAVKGIAESSADAGELAISKFIDRR